MGIRTYFLTLLKPNNIYDDYFYLPENIAPGTVESVNFINSIIINKNIDVVINQSGIYPISINPLFKACDGTSTRIFTVFHNCVKCLLENYNTVIQDNIKSKRLNNFLRIQPISYLLKQMHRIRYGRYFLNAIRGSDKFVFLFPSFEKELNHYIGSKIRPQIISIPNPKPFQTSKPEILSEKENSILFVGRVNFGQKRADLLVEIWSELLDKYPEWRLDIVGDGPKLADLKLLSKYHQLERINFHGFQNPEPYYTKAKILCVPSAFEGYGMVMVEALSFGTVPVSFRNFSAIDEIIVNKRCGIIVDGSQSKDMSISLSKLMDDQNLRTQFALSGLDHVKKFDSNVIARSWVKEFERNERKG